MRQAALHATTTEQDRDASLNAGTETLSFFEDTTLLVSFPAGSFLSSALRNTYQLNSCSPTGMDAVLAVKAAVGAVELGSMSEGLLMALQRGFDLDFIVGITLQDLILGNQSLGTFGEKDLVSEFHWSEHLAPLDQVGMGLENGINLLPVRHLLSLQHQSGWWQGELAFVIVGYVAQINWRLAFGLLVVQAAVILLMSLKFKPSEGISEVKIDGVGVVLAAVGIILNFWF